MLELPEFINALRAVPSYEDVPIAICTGTPERARPLAAAVGAMCCRAKPVDVDQLHNSFEIIGQEHREAVRVP